MRIVSGPTGSGKTALAEILSPTIFNADPFQFYKEIPILSNQPQKKSGFYFMADRSIENPANAGDFSREALPYLDREGIWVGIGLYLGAALFGLDEDRKKGTPFQGKPRTNFKMLVINPERKDLYASLDQRVDQMLERGAMDEAKKILQMKLDPKNPVLKAIGLKHLIEHLQGKSDFAECLRLWKRDTRRLAKRQMTWLRKFCPPSKDCIWLTPTPLDLAKAREFLETS